MIDIVPALETERLLLRGWQVDDYESYAAFLADDRANQYRGGAVDHDTAWTRMEALSGGWGLRGYGIFAVEDKESGALAGWAGLWHPARLEEPELCWSIFPAFAGQGYAGEAAYAALAWWTLIEEQAAPFSMTHPENIASQRVAEKLGAHRGGDIIFDGRTSFFFRHQVPQGSQIKDASQVQDISHISDAAQ